MATTTISVMSDKPNFYTPTPRPDLKRARYTESVVPQKHHDVLELGLYEFIQIPSIRLIIEEYWIADWMLFHYTLTPEGKKWQIHFTRRFAIQDDD